MSSFRPDLELDRERPDFVPLSLTGAPPIDVSEIEAASANQFAAATTRGAAVEVGLPVGAHADEAGDEAEAASSSPSAPSAGEIAALEQAAFDRGVETGRGEATQLASACDAFEAAAQAWSAAARTTIASNREAVINLASEIVRHWVGDQLEADSVLLATLVDRAIEELGAESDTEIFLHPEDAARLSRDASDRFAAWEAAGIVGPSGDPTLAPGDFRIESPERLLDGRLDRVLESVREALRLALECADPEASS